MSKDKDKKTAPIKSSIRIRVQILYLLMVFLGLGILARVLYIQYGPNGDDYRAQGERKSIKLFRTEGMRGDIYSRDMELIATSQKFYMVGIDFGIDKFNTATWKKNLPVLSRQLASMFGGSADKYSNDLSRSFNIYKRDSTPRYVRVTPRWVSQRERDKVLGFAQLNLKPNVGGRNYEDKIERVQPFGELAARTIGRTSPNVVSIDDPQGGNKKYSAYDVRPMYGLELSFNDYLQGTAGWEMRQKINNKFWAPVESPYNVEPQDGSDVITTLDMEIQDIAESVLSAQILKMNADWGCVAVMEVATGELRAIANLTPYGERCREDNNYIIGGRFEPGSTFKLASLMTLIELGGYELDQKVITKSPARIGKRKAAYEDTHPKDTMTVLEMFAESSNVGFVRSVRDEFKDTPEKYLDFLESLGLKDTLGTGIRGEAKPVMWSPKDGARYWQHDLTLNQMAYGYGFEISPLHTLTLYNAVANGGKMVRPRLVTAISRYGEIIEEFPVEYINTKICSNETIEKLRQCMEGVVDSGTGSALRNPYYKVAAKTGTARMAFPAGERAAGDAYMNKSGARQYLATMVGYFPADNPKYSIIVCFKANNRKCPNYYGAGLAGPVFKAVADRLYAKHVEWQPSVEQKIKSDTVVHIPAPAHIKHGMYDDVHYAAKELDQKLIYNTSNDAWVKVDNKTQEITDATISEGKVPNVVGMGAKDALYLMEKAGLKVLFEGRGVVTRQSVAAGSYAAGQTVVLTLK